MKFRSVRLTTQNYYLVIVIERPLRPGEVHSRNSRVPSLGRNRASRAARRGRSKVCRSSPQDLTLSGPWKDLPLDKLPSGWNVLPGDSNGIIISCNLIVRRRDVWTINIHFSIGPTLIASKYVPFPPLSSYCSVNIWRARFVLHQFGYLIWPYDVWESSRLTIVREQAQEVC